MGSSGAQIRKNISEIREIMKKKLKSPVSIEFAHSILYFERPANLMSKEIRPVYSNVKYQNSRRRRYEWGRGAAGRGV